MAESTMTDKLEAQEREFTAATPMEAQIKFGEMVERVQATGIAAGLQVGDKAKDFQLANAQGEQITLYEELAKGPVVLVFYRGGWCPFCNIQLKAYQQILPEIRALGAQLIAVSPQSPDNSLSLQEKQGLEFQVVSDLNGLVTARYNLLFDVPQGAREVFESFGLNLAEYNNTARWILPVPATYMIDENAIIRSAYVNPNFMKRQSPDEILRELGKL